MSEELRSLISSAMTELNPESQDTQSQVADEEALDDSDYEVETSEDTEDDTEVEAEDDEESDEEVADEAADDEADDESADKKETYTVKVNGESIDVTLNELKSGYQRQSDYTREKQALKKEIEEFDSVKEQLVGAFEGVQALEAAWEEDPITVLAQFASNTDNPTHAVALLIKELAPLLDRDFLEMFGVTPDVQRQWSQENQVSKSQRQQTEHGSRRDQELAAAQEELEIQNAIVEYDRQIDEILESENLNFTVKQRGEFRKELAKYAADNELTNLKAAYKAFKYEELQTKKQVAAKTAAKAKEKKAAKVVTRSGAGSDGGNPVNDNSDLHSVVLAAMKDTQSNLK